MLYIVDRDYGGIVTLGFGNDWVIVEGKRKKDGFGETVSGFELLETTSIAGTNELRQFINSDVYMFTK